MRDLVFYPDDRPGFTRIRRGRGFAYRAPDGTHVACKKKRAQLTGLAVPPAYEDVWISPRENGHLQATGRDVRDRKQYMYHPHWSRLQAGKKFDRLADFGASLPKIRRWIAKNLKGNSDDQDTAIAVALSLMDRLSMRVGHPDYSRENGSYGATTLLGCHLREVDGKLRLAWSAKGGRPVEKPIVGAVLASVLRKKAADKSRHLVTWTFRGRRRRLRGADLNDRLAGITNTDISVKAFRTWNGTHSAFLAATERESVATLTELAKAASRRLHNTPEIARASYIHPVVLDQRADLANATIGSARRGRRRGEGELLALLGSAEPLAGDIRLLE